MKEITMLHIGDIHYEKFSMESESVDMKDKQFPDKLKSHLTSDSRILINEKLIKEIDSSPLRILISGDLSIQGKISKYKECLDFINELMLPKLLESNLSQNLCIVPGNHDIDRKINSENYSDEKFIVINKALEEKNFPTIPYPEVKIQKLPENSTGSVLIISLNSCIGCGEKRYYPQKIQDAINHYLKDKDEKEREEWTNFCFEEIDTPLVKSEDIKKIIEGIRSADCNCLPIILTHHNILPQKTTRIAMYTELINSGSLREILLKMDRPIIYLHGHIHDDPIEIIQSARYKNSRLICISAPLLYPDKDTKKAGFNKLKIIYDSKGLPLGCEIISYRIVDGIIEPESQKIRFWDSYNTLNYVNEKDRIFLRYITDRLSYLGDLEDGIKISNGQNIPIEEIERELSRLNWLGFVQYDPQENDVPNMRIVKKVIP